MKKRERSLVIYFDEGMHLKFKIMCIKQGKTMTDVLKEFVGNYVRNGEHEAKSKKR